MTNWRDTFFSQSPLSIGLNLDFPEINPSSVPSLLSQLTPYEIGNTPLPDELNLLPCINTSCDEYSVAFNWSAGAREGLILHQRIGRSIEQLPSDSDSEQFAILVYQAIKQTLLVPDKRHLAHFYTVICQDKLAPISYLPHLIHKIEKDTSVKNSPIYFQVILWILYNSPDKNPVKIALALLVHFRDKQSQRLLFLFALHPEFTLYTLRALQQRLAHNDIETLFFSLGKRTKDWGRIQFIEYLPSLLTIDNRYWLLTQGYKNNVMVEYVAYDCATKGHLVEMLAQTPCDLVLLMGCSDILRALLNGGPAKDIYDYKQGPQACLLFISQVDEIQPQALKLLYCVCEIADFIQNSGEDWISLGELGWSDYFQQQIMAITQRIVKKPQWLELIIEGLRSPSRTLNYQASLVAKSLRFDIWELLFSLQKEKAHADWWHQLMQTDSTHKVEKVVKLAEQQMALTQSKSTDAQLIPHYPEYQPHHAVEYIMQDLGRFPGVGWSLIKRQLQSRVLRDRNMALNVLSAWPDALWTHELDEALTQALAIETDNHVHQRIRLFLSNHRGNG